MSQAAESVFDTQEALCIVKARWEAVRGLIGELSQTLALRTALDVGCGIGHFSRFLADNGFDVVAADGREQNIAEAKVRYPGIDFRVANVEDDSLTQLGSFDLVFCMGLLYHLENPFLSIRRLHAAAKACLLLESMCIPEASPSMLLREESRHDNQSLTHVAFYPTESCLVKMLYRAGFNRVYRLATLPDHDDFRETRDHKRRRTVLLASRAPITPPTLLPVAEPAQTSNPWDKTRPSQGPLARRMARFLTRVFHEQR